MAVHLDEDLFWFIKRHFNQNDLPAVYEALDCDALRTQRVARAVLYLSNGSVSLLRHNARACAVDLPGVLTQAEYVVGVSEMPMQVRDMSLPFWHERNLGSAWRATDTGQSKPRPAAAPQKASAAPGENHHRYLASKRFELGTIEYVVATRQPRSRQVRCFRRERNAFTLVELPLTFVMEQVAEKIEVTDATAY